MENEREIIKMSIRKILCFREHNGEHIIFKHDNLNTERKIDELMELIDILIK